MPKYDNIMADYFDLPNPALGSYFGRTRHGNPDVYRTTFFKDREPQDVLSEWMKSVQVLKQDWPTLLTFEEDLASKVGPLSVQKPLVDRLPDVQAYYDCINLESKPLQKEAVQAFLKELKGLNTLSMRGIPATIENMKLSTSSGCPFFTRRKNDVRRHRYGDVSFDGTTIHAEIGGKDYKMAAILGWRGQEGGPKNSDVKQRVVWMFPFTVNLQELRVYQPFMDMLQKHKVVPAWVGLDEVDNKITKLFDTKGKDDVVICTDFSKFDQHFNEDCQKVAHDVLAWLFIGDSRMESWLRNVFPVKYNIPIICDDNIVKNGRHGMGSGSGGTNQDETLLHRVLQHEAALSVGQDLNLNSQCLGDDGILTYPGIKVEDVIRTYTAHGQEMNPDKQYVSKQDCVYLRRWHHKDYRENGVCVGVYSTARALGRMMYQERYYDPDEWGKEMVALRQLSILENCKHHPLKEKFVDYCMKGDKYRLGVDIPGFLDNLETLSEKAIEVMPDFMGYTQSLGHKDEKISKGINDWWIVKYLKSKA
nr:MAG: RNA-dependent RNA polymerase [Human picobirnavirus]